MGRTAVPHFFRAGVCGVHQSHIFSELDYGAYSSPTFFSEQEYGVYNSPTFFSEPEYGAYNSPTLGTRQQAIVAVSESEANGESGFNSTADIVVEEPESGSLEVGVMVTHWSAVFSTRLDM